jgi:hypothetical protein
VDKLIRGNPKTILLTRIFLKEFIMKKTQFVAVALLAQVSLVSAATVYTDEATFLAQLNPQYFLEDFNNYTFGVPLDGSQPTANYGSVNGYSWSASVPNNWPSSYGIVGLYSLPNALTTYAAEDKLTINFTGKPVTALGGIFASTDINGDVIQQTVTVTLSDNTTVSLTGSGFLGFTSNFAISYLTIDGLDTPNSNWPQLSHFYTGSAEIAAVPAPAAVWLFGSGLLGLSSFKRRGLYRLIKTKSGKGLIFG